MIKSKSAIPSILRCVKDNNPRVRGTAVHALGDLRAHKAISLIITALKDKDRWVLRNASNTVGIIGTGKTFMALESAQTDKRKEVRDSAAKAIMQIQIREAITSLLNSEAQVYPRDFFLCGFNCVCLSSR
jgi:HEAT repeat protein